VPIRIILAEDHYLVREGERTLIESDPDFELVAICTDLDSLLLAIDTEKPDVVVTDIKMPPNFNDEGIQVAERLRETNPGVGVVVISLFDDASFALALLEKGSQGRAYLLKDRLSDAEQFAGTIKRVARGESVIDPKVVDVLLAARLRAKSSPLHDLTPRESEILGEMAQGWNNAAIAANFALSERAVEKHIHSIFFKLGLSEEQDINRRVKAVLLFLSQKSG
jgi:DNA-binding NarL/FixJ family response regulator